MGFILVSSNSSYRATLRGMHNIGKQTLCLPVFYNLALAVHTYCPCNIPLNTVTF